jgi:hypothetical protein
MLISSPDNKPHTEGHMHAMTWHSSTHITQCRHVSKYKATWSLPISPSNLLSVGPLTAFEPENPVTQGTGKESIDWNVRISNSSPSARKRPHKSSGDLGRPGAITNAVGAVGAEQIHLWISAWQAHTVNRDASVLPRVLPQQCHVPLRSSQPLAALASNYACISRVASRCCFSSHLPV